MKLKVVSFIATQLLLFGAFLLIMKYSDFDLVSPSGDIEIEITSSDRDSDDLVLSGPEEVYAGRKITWRIGKTAEDVIWFGILKKPGHKDVFKGANPTGDRQGPAVGRLRNQTKRIDYEYSIMWEDRAGDYHPYDPKIAIKPGSSVFQILIYSFSYALLVALITFLTFKK